MGHNVSKKRVGSEPVGRFRYNKNEKTVKKAKKDDVVVESYVKSSDEEVLEVDYDEEYDTHEYRNGIVWLHRLGHEKIQENSKRHQHKHRKPTTTKKTKGSSWATMNSLMAAFTFLARN